MPDDDHLHRLVYYSRNRIDGPLNEAVRTILAASRRNNAPLAVTGALMFNAGCFAQVLEGDRAVLESTFERIQQDPRHGDVSVLAFEPIAARSFGQWSMGFVGARPDHAAAFADVATASGFDPAVASGDEVLRALHGLALEDEDASA
ncbi:BLUF domain-containing protein [Lichenihabitans sp. Uapishka_5]|uniref:BLUF domain-containing protein n=1 Tax=Lichenihabitans sp. Uapishka_5 TaxID=3037302 RepID=UPI0029E7FC49|nr:BLUF domain-containing protein [Lichenihabitans sp. Uapishka_5]MDX7952933.1 BLUF domain-containing protein [Lichenihabitans sp. Uapishka_5]